VYWEPHEYQKKAVKFLVEHGSGQLWLDPGLGKTSITLQAFKILKAAGAVKKALIVAPLRPAYAVWPQEIKKWDNFADLRISVLHGANKDKYLDDKSDIHVINFEGLQWLSKALSSNSFPYDILVVDEISYLRNTRTERFKCLSPFLDKFKRRFGLTGSPAPNSLMDVFGPQLVIDRGATFGRFITHFRTTYFFQTGYGGYTWALKPNASKQIYELLSDKVLRMKAEDYLDMPEMLLNRVYVELPKAVKKRYKELENELLIEFSNDDQVSATNAAVAVGKCQQIANGAIYLDDTDREYKVLHDEKIDALDELLEGLNGKPCIVGYHFNHDLLRLQKYLPNAPYIGSGVSPKEMQKIINQWNAGDIPVLLAHPQSAGHGLNLQGTGHAVIWFSNTWSLEIYDQFVRRLWRQGQKNNIVVHQIIAKDTIDEAIVAAINTKDKSQQALMNAVRDYSKKVREREEVT
jgi:SNF2 family DNA or RNA helicase